MNNQNESPFGNPKFIASIIVVFLMLWGWQYYMNKTYPPAPAKPAATEVAGSTANGSANGTVSAEVGTGASAATIGSNGTANLAQQAAETATEKTFSYEDENVKWSLSSFGMGLNSLELKKYTNKQKQPIVFNSSEKLFANTVENQNVFYKLEQTSATEFVGTATVNGKNIRRTVVYHPETMSFTSEVSFDTTPSTVTFSTAEPKLVISSGNFFLPSFERQDFLFQDAEKVKTEHVSGLKDEETLSKSASNIRLASIGSQYFTQSYIDKSDVLPSLNMNVANKTAKMDVVYDLKDAKVSRLSNIIFIGPKVPENLNKIDPLLPEVMDYGIFGFISKPLLSLMKFMFGIFGNWGLAIIALTIVVRFVMLPFNIVSFKSARAMQKIQPELQAVREKYKNDPMAVNRETMALMKQHNANPLSSCLPMLIQIPIFFALWRTIGSSIEIYQQPFFGWITDLSSHDKFFVLPVLMGVTMFFQQKLTPTTMDPMQAKILNFMPILFSLFMLSLPSGLTLYNFVSALFGVGQQYFLMKDRKTDKKADDAVGALAKKVSLKAKK
ncbi:membrane protein insertase YidC [Pseudobdellovibrio exovorus]|uniref:Membrane protein insertase YidC n=1 Tax=Pseudobdellovibrio exovorus JSS TaxID=1184267 RepID=M4VFK3_9BACT|nr:membrane protein insertase YidC [Pseudobdellovibrio exovorus]AGH96836.1 60 kDa inner-membrane protein [Pseudobdellovibrio exovorus JSS]